MLKKFYSLILLTQRSSRRHPKTVLGVFLALTVVLCFGLPRLQFLLSVDDLVDQDFKSYPALKAVNQEFQDRNTVLLSVESDQPFTKKYLCDLQIWILKVADSFPAEISSIHSTFGIREVVIEQQKLTMNSPLEVDCLSDLPETEKIKAAFDKLRSTPWHGILTTLTGYGLTVNFVVSPSPDQRYGNQNVDIFDKIKKDYRQTLSQHDYQTYFAGVTTYQSFLKQAMDITQSLNLIMFVISLLIFRYFLGTWKAGFIYNFTILIASIWVNGLMGYTGIPIDVLSNTTGLLLFVSCLEDFVFITYGVKKFGWTLSQSLRRFAVASFFTSLTTAIGFGSLGTSELGIIRRTGYIVAFGGMLEWVVIFLIFPALLQGRIKTFLSFKTTTKRVIPLKKIVSFEIGTKTTWFLILLAFCTLFFAGNLKVKDSPESFFYESHDINKTSRHMKATRGWTNENSLIFSEGNSDSVNIDLLNKIKTHPIVKNVESSYMIEDDLTKNIEHSERNALLQLWRDSTFSRRLISDKNLHRAQIYLNTMDNDIIDEFIKFTENICGDRCHIVGTIISYSEFSNRVLKTLFDSFSTSLILIMLVIVLIRKPLGFKEILYCILSALWGPLALLGIFVWLQIPVFFISSICASVLVGIAGDNAIQYIFNAKKQKLSASLEALSEASFIITFGYCLLLCVFFLSPLAPLSKLGVFMIMGIFLGYFGDLYILKGLLKK